MNIVMKSLLDSFRIFSFEAVKRCDVDGGACSGHETTRVLLQQQLGRSRCEQEAG